jgi:uncharacterized lipoprotein YajG
MTKQVRSDEKRMANADAASPNAIQTPNASAPFRGWPRRQVGSIEWICPACQHYQYGSMSGTPTPAGSGPGSPFKNNSMRFNDMPRRHPRNRLNTYLGLLCLSLLGGCSTHSVELTYKPTMTIVPISSSTPVSVGSFVDNRGESTTWFGAIRGGYGSPIKVLEATSSVSTLVQSAFSQGLQDRGLQVSSSGHRQIAGVIKKLDCDQFERREATIEIEVSIIETATGNRLFNQTFTAHHVEGSIIALDAGIFGSVEKLRALAEKTLSEVVDKALDDSALQRALLQ